MTSDMMFYVRSAARAEEKIRQEGLAELRRKIYNKMQRYESAKRWEGSQWLGYEG